MGATLARRCFGAVAAAYGDGATGRVLVVNSKMLNVPVSTITLIDRDRQIYLSQQGVKEPEYILRPITADDARADHAAVMETREQLRLWEQSTWPTDDFTAEANREDLVGLEQRHAEQSRRARNNARQRPDDVEGGCPRARVFG